MHLIDLIITSEETGYRKPDRGIFQYAIEQLGASLDTTCMIGDSVDSDIKGALDAQLAAIIHRFEPRFASAPGKLVIEGIGIDLVTEPRHCLQVSKERVQFLAQRMGMVLEAAAKKRYIPAMSHIESMIRVIAKGAGHIDEEMIQISFPGRELDDTIANKPDCHVTERDRSIRAEYVRLALDTVSDNEAALQEVASLLQGHCNDLMRDCPRAAIRQLLCAMLILAEQAGIRQKTTVTGEQIDQ
ncbi:hypothetical protein TrVFT333_006317 [Trichoderma virens FT-333]|nr:hypothetical protein TrVFT333_006317 [Trichoderma virens FT-333]